MENKFVSKVILVRFWNWLKVGGLSYLKSFFFWGGGKCGVTAVRGGQSKVTVT
jgi:hypothetical protein